MLQFEWILALMIAAVALTALSRTLKLPYPVLLALGGTALALFPRTPAFTLNPELTLALFVAPVLFNSAYDFSLRDLKSNWIPVTFLVVLAVGVTTAAVAYVTRTLIPDMPLAAAVALGAIVAPPDAAAATTVLRQMNLPHRLMVILEGESLLNDASALLIYRLAISAAAAESFNATDFGRALALGVLASVGVGYVLAHSFVELISRVEDAPSATVLQFAATFGVWLLADRLSLSPIITLVVFAFTAAQLAPQRMAARVRVSSYAVWQTAVFVLNVLAFVLVGLQLRPAVLSLAPSLRDRYLSVAGAVLATVILVRLAWVAGYVGAARLKAHYLGTGSWPANPVPSWAGALVASWSGMRGVVTLAAAYALPLATKHSALFPYRNFILLCAFTVVVGTLVLHGLTLRPLLQLMNLRGDDTVRREVSLAQQEMNRAALVAIDGNGSAEAMALRRELSSGNQLVDGEGCTEPAAPRKLRAIIIERQRTVLFKLRSEGMIGDDAFHDLEAQLDLAELNMINELR